MRKFFPLSAIIVVLAGFITSCVAPASREFFVKNSQRDSLGRYAFELAMDDSLAVYSLRLYTRIDIGDNSFSTMKSPAVDVLLVAPSGMEFSERIFLPKQNFKYNGILAKDFDMPYRSNFRPVECGVWKMFLSLPEPVENLRGMGIKLSKWERTN